MQAAESKPRRERWTTPFFIIWTGQAFSLIGSQLVQFALIWWLTKTTGSATVLATASLAGLLPQVFLGPIIGPLIDRWNRRVTMIVADSAIALATIGLGFLFWSGQIEIWHVYVLMFFRAVAGAFHWPAMKASTSLMVPKEHLARVQGLNQMIQGGMSIVSAPLGALLLDWLSIQGILFIDVGTALMAVLPLLFIPVPQPQPAAGARAASGKATFWDDFRSGLCYVFGWPGLVIIGGMAMLINFLISPSFALLPLLVTEHFGGQAIQLAGLESTLGIGVIIGGLFLSVWGGFRRRIATSLVGLLGMDVGGLMIGVAPASAYPLAIAAMFVIGFSLPITNGPLMAAAQAVVEPDMQGRVFTLMGSVSGAMSPLGLIIAAPVADKLGIQTWFIIGGIVTFVMGIAGYFIPAAMNLEDGRPTKDRPAGEPMIEILAPGSVDGD